MAGYLELLAQRKQLDQQIASIRDQERASQIESIRETMRLYDISIDEIRVKASGRKGQPAVPKYRHPDTGATWSGRGKRPRWLGDNPAQFLIEKPAEVTQ
ncbi:MULTISPECIES: H-NS histone family protein [Burkholderia]|uniref:H-NS histone family protein n=1 Tax=Burkholderia TaxID=32008 RepID=UPI000BF81897|nr:MULTISPECIES: H-NS histone family protein [Burkholderia]PFH12736.1 DNA-binding protein H-NS [Burkholderia sp. JKS000303]RQZ31631.1 H-NS histone family protein [Burkholderia sp. Bp9017]RQZ37762.1 H-NS histone family protein [Burkholderia sp. Bp9016]